MCIFSLRNLLFFYIALNGMNLNCFLSFVGLPPHALGDRWRVDPL